MLVKKNLKIKGTTKDLSQILEKVYEKAQELGFDVEHSVKSYEVNDAIFIRGKFDGQMLFEHFEKEGELAIYPGFTGSLEEDRAWNAQFDSFYSSVIEPILKLYTHSIELTSGYIDISEVFSPVLIGLLEKVIRNPRGTNSRFHAWTEFIVKAAVESGDTKADLLGRWLEVSRQPDDEINTMLADYYSANWILSEFFRLYPENDVRLKTEI